LSTFTQLLRRGDFVVTAELDPPKSAAATVVRRRASLPKGYPRPKLKESKSA